MMRVLLVSDIHGNPWALRAVAEDAGRVDHVLCAGDVVNYGPDPAGAVAWLREHQAVVVRGNHDHAVAFGVDPRASPAKQPLAMAMRDWTRDHLDPVDVGWLLTLPRRLTWKAGGATFLLVHGTPVDPLYDYRLVPDAGDDLLQELTSGVTADALMMGHTHLPVLRRRRELHVINPGSVGQPLDGDPRAAYAVWEDGRITLCRADYDRAEVLKSLATLPLSPAQIEDLRRTLQLGSMS